MLKQTQKLCRKQAFIWGWWKWVATAVTSTLISSYKAACDAGPSHCNPGILACCCRPHASELQEQKARDPMHSLLEAQPITSIHAVLSWEPGALPFDEMLRGTTPLQAGCTVCPFHQPCISCASGWLLPGWLRRTLSGMKVAVNTIAAGCT